VKQEAVEMSQSAQANRREPVDVNQSARASRCQSQSAWASWRGPVGEGQSATAGWRVALSEACRVPERASGEVGRPASGAGGRVRDGGSALVSPCRASRRTCGESAPGGVVGERGAAVV
jgi:hypothetical protein